MARPVRSLSSRLRHRLAIVRDVDTPTGSGGFTTTPTTVVPRVPAEIFSLTGSEAVKDKVLRGIRVYKITIRWRADLLQTDQLRLGAAFRNDLINIRSAVDPTGTRRELVILGDTEGVEPA